MSSAGRESYAAGLARLDTMDSDAAGYAQTADELLSVAQLLTREPRLRRALADPARTPEDRVELLRSVLGDQVGNHARDLLAELVSGRWSMPSELLDAVERLGVEAMLASAEQDGKLGDVEDELFRFGQIVSGDVTLASALGDSTVPAARRAELARQLLQGKATQATVRLAELAVFGLGGRSFETSLTRLVESAAQRRDRQVAYVTVAAALTDEEEQRLGAKLAELYGRDISVKVTVVPAILGGMSIQIGHDLYDGTVARRLAQTRQALGRR